MYRRGPSGLEVLLAHPGGPFFRTKDAGAWTIPKGIPSTGEALPDAARREFAEEIGLPAGDGLVALGEVRQKGGKVVHAWAFEGDLPVDFVLRSNTFDLEWPPRSGRRHKFPEVDRAELFPVNVARTKINPAQSVFLDRLEALVEG